tara:strand:- start:1186 stop:1428 length:243 start_codon:yes stop_codon:yes gene_type:complete
MNIEELENKIIDEIEEMKGKLEELKRENINLKSELRLLGTEFDDFVNESSNLTPKVREIQTILEKIWKEENKNEWFIHKL